MIFITRTYILLTRAQIHNIPNYEDARSGMVIGPEGTGEKQIEVLALLCICNTPVEFETAPKNQPHYICSETSTLSGTNTDDTKKDNKKPHINVG